MDLFSDLTWRDTGEACAASNRIRIGVAVASDTDSIESLVTQMEENAELNVIAHAFA